MMTLGIVRKMDWRGKTLEERREALACGLHVNLD
jgi:hypothetical protein